jgi:hypothetical protein
MLGLSCLLHVGSLFLGFGLSCGWDQPGQDFYREDMYRSSLRVFKIVYLLALACIAERLELARCKLVHWIKPLDVCSKQIVLVLDSVLDKVLEFLHFDFDDDFVDFSWGFVCWGPTHGKDLLWTF